MKRIRRISAIIACSLSILCLSLVGAGAVSKDINSDVNSMAKTGEQKTVVITVPSKDVVLPLARTADDTNAERIAAKDMVYPMTAIQTRTNAAAEKDVEDDGFTLIEDGGVDDLDE